MPEAAQHDAVIDAILDVPKLKLLEGLAVPSLADCDADLLSVQLEAVKR